MQDKSDILNIVPRSSVAYKPVYTGKAGFFCYIAGAAMAIPLAVFMLTFTINEPNIGVKITTAFCFAIAITAGALSVMRSVRISKTFLSRAQKAVLAGNKATSAVIKKAQTKYRRFSSNGSKSAFKQIFYDIEYDYYDEQNKKQSGKFKLDSSELNGIVFGEGAQITIAFSGNISVPITHYEIAPTENSPLPLTESVPPIRLAKRKMCPVSEAAKQSKLGTVFLLVALAINFQLIIWGGDFPTSTPLNTLRSVTIWLVIASISIVPLGYAVFHFGKAYAEKSKFKRLLEHGKLTYAAVSNAYIKNNGLPLKENSIYSFYTEHGLQSGAINTKLLDEQMNNVLCDYLSPPYIKTLVLYSENESMIVYYK